MSNELDIHSYPEGLWTVFVMGEDAFNGFTLYGVFTDQTDAQDWADDNLIGSHYWVTPIDATFDSSKMHVNEL